MKCKGGQRKGGYWVSTSYEIFPHSNVITAVNTFFLATMVLLLFVMIRENPIYEQYDCDPVDNKS